MPKNYLAYQVPLLFHDLSAAKEFLKSCGIVRPMDSIGKLYYLLNLLRVESHLAINRYKRPGGWIPLKAELLRVVFGDLKYFYLIARGLEAYGLLEVNPSYKKGVLSKSYRLSSGAQQLDWRLKKRYAIHCSLTERLLKRYYSMWKPVDYGLYRLLTHFRIDEIDFFEKTDVSNFAKFACPLLDTILSDCSSRLQAKYKYCFYKDCYRAIREGEWRYIPDRFGRRHNNLTNLPKALRPFLYVRDKGIKRRLKAVDISNSQVLLLLTILDSGITGFDLFRDIVEEGAFYECLAYMCGIAYSDAIRRQLKEKYFLFVYGDSHLSYVWSSEVYIAMMSYFPEITGYIDALKAGYGYKYPAREMQRQESSIIIDYVCVNALRKRLLFSQIYDSILCLEEDIPVIEQLIKKGFKEKGLNVAVKVE